MDQPPTEGEGLINCLDCGPQPAENFWRHRSTMHHRRPYQVRCKSCSTKWKRARRERLRSFKAAPAVLPVILVGDTHFPFHSEAWLAWVMDVIRYYKPGLVVQVGDLYDLLAFSKYPRSHNIMTPDAEVQEGRMCAEEMWKEIRGIVPDAELVQLRGNHDARLERRVMEHLPEVEGLLMPTLQALWAFEGVKTINESTEEFIRQGVMIHHGHRKFGAHLQYNNMSTATGHLHTGGVVFKQTLEGVIWELNTGCGINVDAPVFTYHSQKRLHGVTLGLGCIDKYGPRFIPFQERR